MMWTFRSGKIVRLSRYCLLMTPAPMTPTPTGPLRGGCAAHARAPSLPRCQEGEALGDAVEDVAGVVVKLHDADFQGFGRADDVPDGDLALAGAAAGPWCRW